MTTAFMTAMMQISIESGEIPKPEEDYDHSGVGAEEIVVVTDETQTELEEAVADTAEKVEKMLENDTAAEKIVEAVDCLESIQVQLSTEAAAGRPLAGFAVPLLNQLIASSMEARQIPAGIFENAVMEIQQSFESNRFEDYTTEAEEKTEGLITKLLNMLKAAAKAVWTYISEFFTTIGRSGTAIKNGGTQIKRLAAKLTGELKKEELKASGYNLLNNGGSFNPAAAVNAVTAGYSTIALAAFGEITGLVKPWVNSVSLTPTVKTVNLQAMNGSVKTSEHDLPGGYKAALKPGAGEGIASVSGAKFTITGPEKKAGPEKTAPLTKGELEALGSALESLGSRLLESKKSGTVVLQAQKTLLDEVDGKLKAIKGEDKEGAKKARAIVSEVSKALSAGKTIIPTYLDFASKVGKQGYNFGKASLGAYGKKVEEKKPEEEPAK